MQHVLFGLFSFFKKEKKQGWAEANHLALKYSDTPENDLIAQQLFLAAHYSIVSDQNLDELYVDRMNTPAEKEGWKNSWDVSNHDEAIDILKWLQIEGHRMSFYELIGIYNSGNRDNLTDEALAMIQLLDKVKNRLKIQGQLPNIGAWDYSRLVNNVRAFHSLGYISKEEAAYYLNAAQNMARKEYKSWEEYSQGFLIGRTTWASEMDEQFIEVHQILLSDENSPYVCFSF